jgi:hypothetical protein
MGKHANQSVYREFERLDRLKQDEAEVLSEEVRASDWDSEHWARIQAEVEFFGAGR